VALQKENKDLLSSISVDNRLLDVLHMGLRIFDRLMLLNMLLLHQEWADLGLGHVLEQARTTEYFKDTAGVAFNFFLEAKGAVINGTTGWTPLQGPPECDPPPPPSPRPPVLSPRTVLGFRR
jgi:hypothetical protein